MSSQTSSTVSADSPSSVSDSPVPRFTDSPKPLSDNKLPANRANAQKSTGPRTKEGKARSSQNATTHALFCQSLLLPNESQELFHALRQTLLQELNPHTILELALADRVIALQWRLQRLQAAETALYLHEQEDLKADVQEHNQTIEEQLQSLNHLQDQARHDPRLKKLRLEKASFYPEMLIARSLHNAHRSRRHTTPLERLSQIEQRLTNLQQKALKQLEHLQTKRKAQTQDPDYRPSDCPFTHLTEEDLRQEEEQPVQAASPASAGGNPDPAHHGAPSASKMKNEPTDPRSSPSCLCASVPSCLSSTIDTPQNAPEDTHPRKTHREGPE